MDLITWYLNQLVSVEDLNRFQSNLDGMFSQLIEDLGMQYAYNGLYAEANNPNAMGIKIHPGRCYFGYDGTAGIANHGTLPAQTVVALDKNNANLPTVVTNSGNSRWLSVWATPTSINDTPVVTPAGNTIQFRTWRGIAFVVTMSVESANPSRPALGSVANGVLLADVKLVYNQTVVAPADVYADRVLSGANGNDRATLPFMLGRLDADLATLQQHLTWIQDLQTRLTTQEARQMTPGPVGAAATIDEVHVTAGAAGSQASVNNTGTAQHAILNFTIPRGDTGAKGDTGNPGPNIIPQGGIPIVNSDGVQYTFKMVSGALVTVAP